MAHVRLASRLSLTLYRFPFTSGDIETGRVSEDEEAWSLRLGRWESSSIGVTDPATATLTSVVLLMESICFSGWFVMFHNQILNRYPIIQNIIEGKTTCEGQHSAGDIGLAPGGDILC